MKTPMSTSQKFSLRSLLEEIRESQTSSRAVGTRFEELVLVYLNHDKEMQSFLENAWTLQDFVKHYKKDWTAQDTGIDLVAKVRDEHGGGFCAIQAKYRSPDTVMRKSHLDSFVNDAGGKSFAHRMFVDSTESTPSIHFQDSINRWEIRHIKLDTLESSSVAWEDFVVRGSVTQGSTKTPRPHQFEALERVMQGLKNANRGQIIMACGTGKTFTALLIAETLCGIGTRVLILVPSLALMSQIIREWHNDRSMDFRSFSVCSDSDVATKIKTMDDRIYLAPTELVIPPTTDASKLAKQATSNDPDRMTVIFGTYHSLAVIHEAQHEHGLPNFDLILCDEAHRTTGQIDADKAASIFVKVHDAHYVRSTKRLYMTATPRIYTTASKAAAKDGAITLCSMDDVEQFGEVFYYRSFAWAVDNNLLSDYKVIVLAIDEAMVSTAMEAYLESDESNIKLDDATKVIGCYKALLKHSHPDRFNEFARDPDPARRSIAFCNTIQNSKIISASFQNVIDGYTGQSAAADSIKKAPKFSVEHVDGTQGSKTRNERLRWIASEPDEHELRILSNVRCLGEGVDVPALDAIVFFHPRKSQIDVVQAVGRVMRKSAGKQYGYVVLPVAIPAGVSPEESLKNNKTYETVWQILNALRSHDERLEAEINRLQLEGEELERVQFLLSIPESAEAYIHARSKGGKPPSNGNSDGHSDRGLDFEQAQALQTAIYAKIVNKCGRATYWQDWAGDVGKIARTQITRITSILQTDHEAQTLFERFVKELQDDLNPSVSTEQSIELLAQHIITRPIFDAMFSGNSFVQQNSVSKAMSEIVVKLDDKNLDRETESLESFYEDVRWRIQDTKTARAKQELIKELYDKFFRKAFSKTTEMLGIAFTPVVMVDYVIHSIEYLLNTHFGMSMSDRGVNILDPFVGTGTFITRLLQSGVIRPQDLQYKYEHEIHANEIVLLAYYVAGINIEAVYHEVRQCSVTTYSPYNKIVFQDTFQNSPQHNLVDSLFPLNQERIDSQNKQPLTVVLGNPPYSRGQKNENDDAQNVSYPKLDARIRTSYVAKSDAQNKNALYDSYIRAFRWASDRLGERGVIGFVTSAGWLDSYSSAGIRACFAEEFSQVYVVNLRGDANLPGKLGEREGETIFESASKLPISITFLIKDRTRDLGDSSRAQIFYHDIGHYLKREEKFAKLRDLQHIGNTPLQTVTPNMHYDWINLRAPEFDRYIPLHSHYKSAGNIFHTRTLGVTTNRDAWIYNFNRTKMSNNVRSSMEFFNEELQRYQKVGRKEDARQFLRKDSTRIAFSAGLIKRIVQEKQLNFDENRFLLAEYRPLTKMWCYFDRNYIERIRHTPKFFTHPNRTVPMICAESPGAHTISFWIVNRLPDLHVMGSAQCFPLLAACEENRDFLAAVALDGTSAPPRTNIASGAKLIRSSFPQLTISDEQIFYYAYGVLQCPEYIDRFETNLKKALPRIPIVATAEEFLEFARIGKTLGELHMNYEEANPYPVLVSLLHEELWKQTDEQTRYRVEKMTFLKKSDRSSIQYNRFIRVTNIPETAYEFQVNGRSLVEWVMDRQRVTTHKDSGIINDPNEFAIETMSDPAYPLKLLQKSIAVAVQTQDLRKSMPSLQIHKQLGH